MAQDLISPPSARRGVAWAGRASQLRRRQLVAHETEPAPVWHLWESMVEVLRSIDHPSSALLCTADGAPLAAYGLPRTDLPRASQQTRRAFASRTRRAAGQRETPGAIETLELTSGQRHTVIASVPSPELGDHLLCVTAEGVSPPLLQAWTRRAAEDLRELLADQPSPSSSSAAE